MTAPAAASESPVHVDRIAFSLMLKQVFAGFHDALFESAFEADSDQRQSSNLELIRRARPQEDAIIEGTWTDLASPGFAAGTDDLAVPAPSDPAQQAAWQEKLRNAFAHRCLPLGMTEEQRTLLDRVFVRRLAMLLEASAPTAFADIAAPAESGVPAEPEPGESPAPIIDHAPPAAVMAHSDALSGATSTHIEESAPPPRITEPDVAAPPPRRGSRGRWVVALGLAVIAALWLMFPQAPHRPSQPPVPQTAITRESPDMPPVPQSPASGDADDESPDAPRIAEPAASGQDLPPEPSAQVITAPVPSALSAATPAPPSETTTEPAASMAATLPEAAAATTDPAVTKADPSVTTPDPAVTAQLDSHMQRGDTALAELRLTLPLADSAMTNYRAVLAIDASHTGARQGLRRVVQRYAELVRSALARGDAAQAERLLTRARSVLPDDTRLQAPGLTPDAFARTYWDTDEAEMPGPP